MFFVYLCFHIPATINKASNLNLHSAGSFDQCKKSYRNSKIERKVQHLHVTCNASLPGTACIIPLCRVSLFAGFFRSKRYETGLQLVKITEVMNQWEYQNYKNDTWVSYYTACKHTLGRNTKKLEPVKVRIFQTRYKGVLRTLSNI